MIKVEQKEISNYSYFLLMFFLPISLLFGNIFLGILFLSVLLQKDKKTMSNPVIISLVVFFLFILINGVFTTDFSIEQGNYKKIVPLLLIPFSILNIEKNVRFKGLLFLFFGIVIIQINSVIGIIDYYYFTEGKKYLLKNYSKINEILNYERPYLGYFSVLNIIISYYFFKQKNKKAIAIIATVFSLLLIIIISARLSIITALFLGVITLFFELNNKKKLIAFSGLTSLLLVFYFSNNTLKDRFLHINKDARVIIWEGAINSFSKTNNFFLGSGSQENTRNELLEHYKNHQDFESIDEKNRFITKNYNTHNQYLNEILRGGVLGLVIFLFPQGFNLYFNFRKKTVTIELLFLISILCFCLVENILDRQIGVYLYAILLSLSNMNDDKLSL
ncbi:O-antigen ligase family protein [Polaribacter gochangensis]|uniref:O-antigen ligase family protein n=1 Tax=Polaribacter gochangensis TaxID=3252903 RepID=UPI0039047222